jgi:hypothetical protein
MKNEPPDWRPGDTPLGNLMHSACWHGVNPSTKGWTPGLRVNSPPYVAGGECEYDNCLYNSGVKGDGFCKKHQHVWDRREQRKLDRARSYKSTRSHGGPSNFICLSCFGSGPGNPCCENRNSVSIGTKLRTPRISQSKKTWMRWARKHLLWRAREIEEDHWGQNFIQKKKNVKRK